MAEVPLRTINIPVRAEVDLELPDTTQTLRHDRTDESGQTPANVYTFRKLFAVPGSTRMGQVMIELVVPQGATHGQLMTYTEDVVRAVGAQIQAMREDGQL